MAKMNEQNDTPNVTMSNTKKDMSKPMKKFRTLPTVPSLQPNVNLFQSLLPPARIPSRMKGTKTKIIREIAN